MLKPECVVCGAKRKYKSLLFDQDLRAYCSSAMVCGRAHPNSIVNRTARGTFLQMMSYEEASQLQRQRTEYTYEESAQMFGKRIKNVNMNRLHSGTISFRVQSEAQGEYISYMIGKLGSSSITEAVQHIINTCMEQDTAFISSYTRNRGAYHETPLVAVEDPVVEAPDHGRDRMSQPKSRLSQADEGVFML